MNQEYRFKHEYAFNQHGQVVHIDNAEKNVRGEKFFKDPLQNIEFIIAHGEKNIKHFRQKSNVDFDFNGRIISTSQINESAEHHNFKMQIIKQGFFLCGNYKFFIQNPKDEYVLIGSRYRVDLYANLLCGTPICIEIIKTSDISIRKENFIRESQILTFKIYINEYGNQELQRFDFFGTNEVEQLSERIVIARREFEKSSTRIGLERRVLRNKIDRFEEYFKTEDARLQNECRKYIEGKESELNKYSENNSDRRKQIEFEINDLQKQIRKIIDSIRTKGSFEIEQIKSSINNVQGESERLTFRLQENGYYKQLHFENAQD